MRYFFIRALGHIGYVRLDYLNMGFHTVLALHVQVSILTGKLGVAERMTSEVLRDLLGVKTDMTNVAVCSILILSSYLELFTSRSYDILDVSLANNFCFEFLQSLLGQQEQNALQAQKGPLEKVMLHLRESWLCCTLNLVVMLHPRNSFSCCDTTYTCKLVMNGTWWVRYFLLTRL